MFTFYATKIQNPFLMPFASPCWSTRLFLECARSQTL